MTRGNFDGYYPAHASRPVRAHGAEDLPQRVHEAEPREHIAGLDIWDNDERPALEQWRAWFEAAGVGLSGAECVECEIGRRCLRNPACVGVCSECGYADCECEVAL